MKLNKAQERLLHGDPSQAGFVVSLLIYAALFVLAELLRPKPQQEQSKPAGLGDFQFPTATEGRPIPLIWGTVRQKGPNVVWYGDYTQQPITEKVKTGLFSSDEVTRGFRYFLGVQFAMCRGPVDSLERLWIGDVEIPISGPISPGGTFTVNCPELFGGDENGQGGVTGTLQFFAGTDSQAVSTYLADYQQEGGDTPAYRGTCYVAPATDSVYLGNSTSIKPWAFELKRIPNPLGLANSGTVNTFDANPANVLYEILTDTEWGRGLPASDIDTSNFAAAGATLASEGNGFSYLLDRQLSMSQLVKLIEEQIDGVLFENRATGKWQITLARDDYDIDTVPEITEATMVELVSFSRGSWDDTTNIVDIKFNDRADTYKETYATAQDSANLRVLQGTALSVEQTFPGVKDADLANFIAWRQLRSLSYPLSKLTVVLDRTFYDVNRGDVLAFTNTQLGLSKLPVRVQRIDYGTATSNRIRVDLIQDVFTAEQPSFGAPAPTGWELPADDLLPFDATDQVAFESPLAIVKRKPGVTGTPPLVWAGARRKGNEIGFDIRQRSAASVPSGAFTDDGTVSRLLFIGELGSSLSVGSALPLATLTLAPGPDTQSALEGSFDDVTDPSDLGLNLVNLIVVDPGGSNEEFMLVTSAQTSGPNVQLNNVYRGALDSVQRNHASGEKVWLLAEGGGLNQTPIDPTFEVDVKLIPFSATDEVAEGDATTINFTMDERVSRPYPPSLITLDGSDWASSTSLEANGSAAEDFAIDLSFRRRDFRTANEVQSLGADAETIDGTFPAANSTVHDVEVRNDPAGTNTLLFTEEDVSGSQLDVLRIKILQATDGVVPTDLRFAITSYHTIAGVEYASRTALTFDFSVTTALTGQFEFGALDTSDVSALYTATVAGTYSFTLSSAFSAGDVEYRLNGGSWTTLIAAGNTSGSIVGVSISDTIEVRHGSSDSGALKQLDMAAAGAGQDGFAILFT